MVKGGQGQTWVQRSGEPWGIELLIEAVCLLTV
jgi:hypothetical protein